MGLQNKTIYKLLTDIERGIIVLPDIPLARDTAQKLLKIFKG